MIQYHLSYNNGAERFQLPVNPSKISISQTHGFQDVEAAQLGEYTVIGKDRLAEFSFSSFFPRHYDPSYCARSPLPNPWDCVRTIERWMKSGEPARLIITGTPINYAVTIRSFTYEPERGGSPGDIYYDISFKEYVFVKTRKVGETKPAAPDSGKEKVSVLSAGDSRPSGTVAPKSYKVVSGDTLWKISQKTLKDGDKWRKIYDANKTLIGPNPNALKVGLTLVIPS